MKGINLVFIEDFDLKELKNSVFITGYAGFGLVGYLASRHIAFTLKMKRIGFVKTRYMPEVTFYIKGTGIVYPFELYYKMINNKKVLVLVNHSIPNIKERTFFAETIANWLKESGVKEAILIGGLDPSVKETPEETYRWIPLQETTISLDAPLLEESHVVGPLALTMMFIASKNIPGIAIFPYAEPYRPDPRATAVAVSIISKILDIEIDVSELYKEASVIEKIESKKEEFIGRVLEAESKSRQHQMYM